MSQEEKNEALVRRFYDEVWGKNNVVVVDELFVPDYKSANLPPWRKPGAAGLKEFVLDNHRMFPDVHHEIELIIARNDKVAVYFRATATHKGDLNGPVGLVPATGKQVHWDGATFFRIEDDKIVETHGVINNMTLMQQLGAVPPPSK
jgi:predicted ester cyclase